jgi:hypothetical protein
MRRLTAALAMSTVIAPIILIILTALALASPVSAASPEMSSYCVVIELPRLEQQL